MSYTLKYLKARMHVLASALTIELTDDNRCEEVFCFLIQLMVLMYCHSYNHQSKYMDS